MDRDIQGKFVKGHKNSKKAKPKVKCICQRCGKATFTYPSQVTKFHNKNCADLAKKGIINPLLAEINRGRTPWNKGMKMPEGFIDKVKKGFEGKTLIAWNKNKTVPQMWGKNHPNYKNGSWINVYGYRVIQNTEKTKGKKVLEHRMVMEEYLGRKLNRDEHIHHINGDKLDNRIENLQVLTATEHQYVHHKGKKHKKHPKGG